MLTPMYPPDRRSFLSLDSEHRRMHAKTLELAVLQARIDLAAVYCTELADQIRARDPHAAELHFNVDHDDSKVSIIRVVGTDGAVMENFFRRPDGGFDIHLAKDLGERLSLVYDLDVQFAEERKHPGYGGYDGNADLLTFDVWRWLIDPADEALVGEYLSGKTVTQIVDEQGARRSAVVAALADAGLKPGNRTPGGSNTWSYDGDGVIPAGAAVFESREAAKAAMTSGHVPLREQDDVEQGSLFAS